MHSIALQLAEASPSGACEPQGCLQEHCLELASSASRHAHCITFQVLLNVSTGTEATSSPPPHPTTTIDIRVCSKLEARI